MAKIINGNALSNWIDGTIVTEIIKGFDGDDIIFGNGGNDTIYGGSGADTIFGYNAHLLVGDSGPDRLFAFGDGTSRTILDGGSGNDRLESSVGGTLKGGSGNDWLGAYNNFTYSIIDNSGNNEVSINGDGKNRLNLRNSGTNQVTIKGDGDNSVDLRGSDGGSIDIDGDGDNIVRTGYGYTQVLAGVEVVNISGYNYFGNPFSYTEWRPNGIGDNKVIADGETYAQFGRGNDTFVGGNSNDTAVGNAGNDTLRGNNGDDDLFGGDGNDKLLGGDGDDFLYGGAGRDTLNGGDGNDTIYGGINDTLIGGGGADLFRLMRDDYTVAGPLQISVHDFRKNQGDVVDISKFGEFSTATFIQAVALSDISFDQKGAMVLSTDDYGVVKIKGTPWDTVDKVNRAIADGSLVIAYDFSGGKG